MNNETHQTAGCFLVRKKNKIWEIALIYKRWSEDNQGWVPPKGHVEEGETLEQAAIRETAEETGYFDIEIIQPLSTLSIEYLDDDSVVQKKDIHYFLAHLRSETRSPLKISESEARTTKKIAWLPLEEAKESLKFDDEREVMRTVITTLKKIN